MAGSLEREIKLRFDSAHAARSAVLALDTTLVRARRLQSDIILDTADGSLSGARSALRVRLEPDRSFLTFKGAPQPSVMKLREELETRVDDGVLLLTILERLGFRVAFRYEKFREEHEGHGVLFAIDETPVGIYVEIEGSDAGITDAATRLGRDESDYIVESYRTLYLLECQARGVEPRDMVFAR